MLKCVECGTKVDLSTEMGEIIECETCGIELKVAQNHLIGLQLGPSEE